MTTKKRNNLLKQAIDRARSSRRLMIIEMPEEYDATPHWLVWMTLGSFIGLAMTIAWQMVNASHSLQAYLPFL